MQRKVLKHLDQAMLNPMILLSCEASLCGGGKAFSGASYFSTGGCSGPSWPWAF